MRYCIKAEENVKVLFAFFLPDLLVPELLT